MEEREKENKMGKKEGKQKIKERRKRNRIERERKERETKEGDFFCVPMVGARRSKKKSRSTHRELRVGTKILEFRQTPLGREFSYLDYFLA